MNTRPDFNLEQVAFCEAIDSFSSKIKDDLANLIRDRDECNFYSKVIEKQYYELVDITRNLQYLCGGAWNDISTFSSYKNFIESQLKDLREEYIPMIEELEKNKLIDASDAEKNDKRYFLTYTKTIKTICESLVNLHIQGKRLYNAEDKLSDSLSFGGNELHFKGKTLLFKKGGKLSFLQKIMTLKPFERVSKDALERIVYGERVQGNKLKGLIGKVNMDVKKAFGIDTAFSIEGEFVRRNK